MSTLLVLSACATKYQPMGSTGGYEQTQLDENAFAIRFYGNSFTKRSTVTHYARLRAAEIGKQLGYQYVALLGEEDRTVSGTYTTPTTTTTAGSLNTSGNTGTFYSTSTTSGGAQSTTKPRVEIIARYFEELPDGRFLELHRVDELYNQLAL